MISRNLVIVGVGLSGLSVLVRLARSHELLGRCDQIVLFDNDLFTPPNLHRYPCLPGMRVGKGKAEFGRQFLLNQGYSGMVYALKASYNPNCDDHALGGGLVRDSLIIDCTDSRELKSSHLACGRSPRIVTGLNKEEYWAAYLPPGCTLDVPLMDRVAARPSCGDQQANARHLMAAMRLGAAVKSLLKTLPKKPMLIAGGGNGD